VGLGVHCPSSHRQFSLRVREGDTSYHAGVAVATAPSVHFLLRTALRRYTVSLAMCDTEREPCAPAPTPTILTSELVTCSRPSLYAPRQEPSRRLAAHAQLISALRYEVDQQFSPYQANNGLVVAAHTFYRSRRSFQAGYDAPIPGIIISGVRGRNFHSQRQRVL